MDATTVIVWGIIVGLFLLGFVAIVGGLLHARRERLLTHAERMKALELGRRLPNAGSIAHMGSAVGQASDPEEGEGKSLARKSFSTALWVAFWGFLAAASGHLNPVVASAIAASVGAIGVTAMICGTILAVRAPAAVAPNLVSKPITEADAFDVVSCRG